MVRIGGEEGERGEQRGTSSRRKPILIYVYSPAPVHRSRRGEDPRKRCKGISSLMNEEENVWKIRSNEPMSYD